MTADNTHDREGAPSPVNPEDRRASTADLSWMLWTVIGIGGIWVAVLLLSLLALDLVSGSQQEHLPIAAFTTWFWDQDGRRLAGSARSQPPALA